MSHVRGTGPAPPDQEGSFETSVSAPTHQRAASAPTPPRTNDPAPPRMGTRAASGCAPHQLAGCQARGQSRLRQRRPGQRHTRVRTVVCPRIMSTDVDVVFCKTPLAVSTSGVSAYRITLSAWKRRDGGMVRSRAWAVLRLMTSSKVVGCSTGRSAGLAPFRILSTKTAARWNISTWLGP
jgi:hypothetical protein